MWTGGSGTTAGGLGERETSRTEGRRKQHCGGDEQGRSNAYKWAPPGAAVAWQPPSAHAREGRLGAIEGRLGRASRPKTGGWATRGARGGGARLGREPASQPAQEREGGSEGEKRISLLIYFLNACFTNLLNKQNRCMVRHGATTKRFNPRVLLTQDVELILARTLKKNKE
jgi:hypothetical protein